MSIVSQCGEEWNLLDFADYYYMIIRYLCVNLRRLRINAYKTMKRTISFLSGLVMIMSVISCVNEEYDLEKIQIDEISGLEGIALPVGSSKVISINDFLALDEDGYVRTDDEGYFFVSLSDEVLNESYKLDEFSFNGYNSKDPMSFYVNESVTVPSSVTDMDFQAVVNMPDQVCEIEITQSNIPEIVSEIRYADVSSQIIVKFVFDKNNLPFNNIYFKAGTLINIPEWIILGDVPSVFKVNDSNQVEFVKDVAIASNGTTFEFPIDAVDFTILPQGQGIISQGQLYLKPSLTLTNIKIILKSSECTAAGTYRPRLDAYVSVDPMTVESICLSGIDLGDTGNFAQDVDLTGLLPEMLNSENVVCDLDDLSLKLWLRNSLPFSGAIKAEIDTYSNGTDSPLHEFEINFPFAMGPAGQYIEHVYTEAGENGANKVDGFDSILNPVPDYLRINTNVTVDSEGEGADYGVLRPGETYSVSCGYEFTAPLSFGKDFRMTINEDITGLNLSISEVELAQAQLKFNLVNSLPLDLLLSAKALDADGNELDYIDIELLGVIKGGTLLSPSNNAMVLTVTNDGELKIDGFRLYMTALVSLDDARLNKHQYIQLTDISISLPEGATYKLNENN